MTWVKAFIARFRGSEFAKDTAVLTLGTTLAQLVAIAAMPILSRQYTPADFGVFAVFLAVSSIVATAITLRYETSILLPKEESESVSLVLLSLALALALGLIVGVTAWLLPEKIKAVIGVSALGGWLPIAVLAGVATAVVAIGAAWFNRQRAYIKMIQLRITQNGVGAICGIALGIYGHTTGLLVAQMISLLVVTAVVMVSLRAMRVQWSKPAMRNVAMKHSAAPKYLLPTALLDVVTLQLPVLLITAWFSNEAAGQFSMAWKILALPMALIGGAMGQVFLQRFSRVWPDLQSARRLLLRTWKVLALVGVLPTILVMIFGEQLFTWVLGNAWGGAGRMASVIAPMLLAILVSSPTSGIFLVLGLQKYSLFFGAAFIVYRSGCIYLGVVNNSVLYGLAAWVVCELVAISAYNLIALKRMRMQ